jgi:O-antigen ligase
MFKNLFLIDDSLTNKISYYHLMVLLATLPFDLFYSHIVFVSFALHTLIHLQKNSWKNLLNFNLLFLQAVFYITLLSCIYTRYSASAATDVTRQLAILLFPVFFALSNFNFNKYRDNLLLTFSLVCLATVIYLYAHAFYVLHYFKLPARFIFSNSFISHNFSLPIGIHATFLSLQIAIALFFMLSQLIRRTANRAFYLLTVLLLFASIVQLGSKAILVAVLLSVNVAVPYFLISGKKRLTYILVTSTLSILLILGTWHTVSFRDRYFNDLKSDLSKVKPDEAVEPRLVRWQAAMELVKKSPLIGYGAGSEISILQDQFYNKKINSALLNRLNSHNQYITFLLITGVIGLLVYLATLTYGFKIAISQNDLLFIVFILLIVTVSVSESMLNAEKGTWFYAFFFSFFIFSVDKTAVNKIPTKTP